MRSFWLALSFIRVPKLFATLLLWPLIAGVLVAITQVALSSFYIHYVDEDTQSFANRLSREDTTTRWIRSELYGAPEALPAVRICRWLEVDGKELPPGDDCQVRPLDVAIHVDSPSTFDIKEYSDFFTGSTQTVHLCKNCRADIVIRPEPGNTISDVHSIQALGVYMLTESRQETAINENFVAAKQTIEHLRDLAGTIYLHAPGFRHPVNISKASFVMILVMNVAFLIILTLWLSLVGHRKVLQYFSRNEALLPLVAACGKGEFYSAIWIITLLRVGFFLLASVPITFIVLNRSISDEIMTAFIGTPTHFCLWVLAIMTSLGALTIIASLAELKNRHSMVSFLYKYVPVTFVLFGTGLWCVTVYYGGSFLARLQIAVSALPLFGLSPVVLSPIFRMEENALIVHSLLATALICLMLRLNSRWFAAHLEEI